MRAKEDIAKLLVDNVVDKMLAKTTWGDVVDVLNNATVAERKGLVSLIINQKDGGRLAGIQLQKAMMVDARKRAEIIISGMLDDDGLSLVDLDALL